MRCVRALLAVALPLVAVGMQLPTAKLSEFFEHARAEVAHASSCADACAALSVDSKRLSDLRYAFCVQFSSLHVTQYCSVAMSQALVRDACQAGCSKRRACDMEQDRRLRLEFDVVRRLWVAGQGPRPQMSQFCPVRHLPDKAYAIQADHLLFHSSRGAAVHASAESACSDVDQGGNHRVIRAAAVQACHAGRDLAMSVGCNISMAAHEAAAVREAVMEVSEDGEVAMAGVLDDGPPEVAAAQAAGEGAHAGSFRGRAAAEEAAELARRLAEEEQARARAAEEEQARARAAEEEQARARAAEEEQARVRAAEEEQARVRAAEEKEEAARIRAADEAARAELDDEFGEN